MNVISTKQYAKRIWHRNTLLFKNAAWLSGSTLINSGLGFVYWWLAARLFPPAAVGLGSAIVSAMMLLGIVGMLGLGTLLIGELPRRRAEAKSLLSTALLTSGGAAAILGLLFTCTTPWFSSELSVLAQTPFNTALFVLGVVLSGSLMVADQAMIGLMRGEIQLRRTAVVAVVKLLLLIPAGLWFARHSGLDIYLTWLIGLLASIGVLIPPFLRGRRWPGSYRPQWRFLQSLGSLALTHHLFNIIGQVPGATLPLIITSLYSSALNASFAMAWLLYTILSLIPGSLTTVLHAIGSGQPEVLQQKIRLTLILSSGFQLFSSIVLMVTAEWILRLFGQSYAAEASWCLRLLAISALPQIIAQHHNTICRIKGIVGRRIGLLAFGVGLKLLLATLGAHYGALTGLALGWLVGASIEALLMGRLVFVTTFTAPSVAPANLLRTSE